MELTAPAVVHDACGWVFESVVPFELAPMTLIQFTEYGGFDCALAAMANASNKNPIMNAEEILEVIANIDKRHIETLLLAISLVHPTMANN